MPLSKHFGGHGQEVMDNMMKEYGPGKAQRVFYATENSQKNKHMQTMLDHARRMHEMKSKLMKGK
jgi:hypothetical protein